METQDIFGVRIQSRTLAAALEFSGTEKRYTENGSLELYRRVITTPKT